jgi:hypothetical protein
MATLARLVLSFAAAFAFVGHPARIPPGVREIGVHSSLGASRHVTNPGKVAEIVRRFDALPKAPHGIYHCPMLRYRLPTAFVFRGVRGVVLARARTPGRAACGSSFDYSVRGRPQKPVLKGHFLARVGRLLGMRLTPRYR